MAQTHVLYMMTRCITCHAASRLVFCLLPPTVPALQYRPDLSHTPGPVLDNEQMNHRSTSCSSVPCTENSGVVSELRRRRSNGDPVNSCQQQVISSIIQGCFPGNAEEVAHDVPPPSHTHTHIHTSPCPSGHQAYCLGNL